jgi:O-methyltransferase
MRNTIKSAVNSLFGLAGLAVCSRETLQKSGKFDGIRGRYLRFLEDSEALLRRSLLPDLKGCPDRHELMLELIGTPSTEAFYLLNYLCKARGVAGDVCEFGVAEGATSALLANEIREIDKDLWLYDSFQGLPKPTEKDVLIHDIFNLGSMQKYAGRMACPQEMVRNRLSKIGFPMNRVHIVPGFIETNGGTHVPNKISFTYVDFDFYEPIKIVLDLVHERVTPGGFIMIDDYNFFSTGPQLATDEFVAAHGDQYRLILPEEPIVGFAILAKMK